MNKFTSGPWKVTEGLGPDGEIVFHEIRDQNGKIITSTWCGPNEELANLIAAAPAMYAVLESLKTNLELHKNEHRWAFALLQGVDAALKKAKGE